MKINAYKLIISSIILCLSLGISVSYASGDTFAPVPTQYSYIPHVYLDGFTGSTVTGNGDILQPIWQSSDQNLFAYGQGNYGYSNQDWAENPWTGSFALGYRQIVSDAAVLGAYVFGDYTRTTTNHSIWLVSPGIEALGRAWEFHANGYFPISKKDWRTSGFASEYGNYNYIHFSGHNQFDAKLMFNEETGPGADAELGRTLFKVHNTVVKGFINGYYFNMRNNSDVGGGGAAITVQPNTYLKFSANGSYDNYAHTVVMLGAQVSLYDLFNNASKVNNDQDLQPRLFDPIERGFGTLASGSITRMTGGPRDEENRKEPKAVVLGHNFLQRTNVWFFNGSGFAQTTGVGVAQDLADGTFRHPFTAADFNQATVKQIFDETLATGAFSNAYLYFNKGVYNTFETASVGASFVHLELFPGESMWGREGTQKGYQMPASGDNRPDIIGGLQLDSDTSLNDLMLHNDRAEGAALDDGVEITNAQNVEIADVAIGNITDRNIAYPIGIKLISSSIKIIDSQVYGYVPAPIPNQVGFPTFVPATGIQTAGGSNIYTERSIIEGRGFINGTGIDIIPDGGIGQDGNIEVGEIVGDGSSEIIGDGGNQPGDAGIAIEAHNCHDTEGNIEIGKIKGVKLEAEGYNASGLSAQLDETAPTAGLAGSKIEIGEITDVDIDASATDGVAVGINVANNQTDGEVSIDSVTQINIAVAADTGFSAGVFLSADSSINVAGNTSDAAITDYLTNPANGNNYNGGGVIVE